MLHSETTLGIFGKIPARGDFFWRRLPRTFLDPWDTWLGSAINQSRVDLGDGWLAAFLISPIWRFALARGVCGETAVAGVLMPSVDSVNRHFPLTLAAVLPASCSPFAAATAEAWFAQIEDLGLACLAQQLDPEAIEEGLDAIDGPHVAAAPRPCAPTETANPLICERSSWLYDPHVPGFLLECLYPAALDKFATRAVGAYSLWWTAGSDAVRPVMQIFRGLPPDREFASFLTGRGPEPFAASGTPRHAAGDGANDDA